jgi:hypothetical protein
MGKEADIAAELRVIIDAALHGEVTAEQIGRVHEMGRAASVAFGLAQNRRIIELAGKQAGGPHTPSGAVPPYEKPSPTKRRKLRPGARKGHAGSRRAPVVPQAHAEVAPLATCPDCGGAVEDATKVRTRIVEDLLANLSTLATEYTIPRHWCSGCKKHVEPGVPAAMPGATICRHRGPTRLAVFTAESGPETRCFPTIESRVGPRVRRGFVFGRSNIGGWDRSRTCDRGRRSRTARRSSWPKACSFILSPRFT